MERCRELGWGVLLLVLLCGTAWAGPEQLAEGDWVRISGHIRDAEGRPIVGATVQVVGATYAAGTDSRGRFRLRAAQQARYVLRAAYVGYKSVERAVAGREGQTGDAGAFRTDIAGVDFVLEENLNAIEEVVVTGTRTARPLKEVPVITKVISSKEMEAIDPVDLPSLLEYTLPGIQFNYNSMSGSAELSYQGMDAKSVLFLVDGERLGGEGSDHNIDFNRIDMSNVERIEVVRGAASTHYDSRAIGGVINIITKKAVRPLAVDLHTRYAFQNGQQYGVKVGVRRSNWSSYTSGSFRQRSTYAVEDLEDGTVETAVGTTEDKRRQAVADRAVIYGYQAWNAEQKFSYNFNRYLVGKLGGSFYTNKRPPREGKHQNQRYTDYMLNGSLRYLISDRQSCELQYAFDDYIKNQRTRATDYERQKYVYTSKRIFNNYSHTVRLGYSGEFGPVVVSSGCEYQREELQHYMFQDSGSRVGNHYSLYTSADWAVLEQLHLVAGVRVDQAYKYHLHPTPKVSLMYTPLSYLTLRANYAHGYRVPTLKELYMSYDMGGIGMFMMYGNPDLKPEKSMQLSLSAEYNRDRVNTTVSFFHNWYDDWIAYEPIINPDKPNAPYPDVRYANLLSAKTAGVESTATFRLPWGFQLMGAYTYTRDFKERDGHNVSYIRPHTARANLMYAYRWKHVSLRTALNAQWGSAIERYVYVSKTDEWKRYDYKQRLICGLVTSAQFPWGVRLGVSLDNLFNYQDKAGEAIAQMPLNGRSYVINLDLNIADMFNL